MVEVALLVVGAVIGFAVNELLGRGVRSLDRRRAQRDPLVVHVEKDPSIIWAGAPPWVGATFLIPADADLSDPPPAHCPDWGAWAHAHGGVDSTQTEVRVTLTAKESLLVVVDGCRQASSGGPPPQLPRLPRQPPPTHPPGSPQIL